MKTVVNNILTVKNGVFWDAQILQHINSLLKTYKLAPTVNFATRVQNSLSTSVDNIFIHNARLSSSYTSPIVNGLSDHDAHFLTISKMENQNSKL
jgi:hypothetical protein